MAPKLQQIQHRKHIIISQLFDATPFYLTSSPGRLGEGEETAWYTLVWLIKVHIKVDVVAGKKFNCDSIIAPPEDEEKCSSCLCSRKFVVHFIEGTVPLHV